MSGRYDSLEEACIDTELENLCLICGASENLSLANPPFARKLKVVKHLLALKADHVVLDLGAGNSFNVLDFFLVAHRKIAVLTPEPVSITNMIRRPKEKSVGRVIQIVAENYLMVHLRDLGSVVYDHRIPEMVSNMVPLTRLGLSREAFVNMYEIVVKMTNEDDKGLTSIVPNAEQSRILHIPSQMHWSCEMPWSGKGVLKREDSGQ